LSHDQEREWFGANDGDAMLFSAAENRWAPGPPGGGGGGGSGDITGVSVSSPLTGGGTSGDVAIGLGTVPVSKGGTGATTEAGARTALGVAEASHTHDVDDITGDEITSYTPTVNFTNTTVTGKVWRKGPIGLFQIQIAFTGAPAAATLEINPLNGLGITVDESALLAGAGRTFLGCVGGVAFDASASSFCKIEAASWVGGATDRAEVWVGSTSTVMVRITQALPFTWASGDAIQVWFALPITEWA
jgi:hypothetical protein